MTKLVVVFVVVMGLYYWYLASPLKKGSPKEQLEFLTNAKDFYWTTVVLLGVIAIFFKPAAFADKHPGIIFLLGMAAAGPLLLHRRKKEKITSVFGSSSTKSVEDLKREYESNKYMGELAARLICCCPFNAANPYNPQYQMTPEQHLDLHVINDWIEAGKPTSNKRYWEMP